MTIGELHLGYWLRHFALPTSAECVPFVYVIRADGDTPVKIGKADDVYARLATLQTGNPRKLTVQRVIPAPQALEAMLHRHMAKSRMVGEWFDGPQVDELLTHLEGMGEAMVDAHDGGPQPPPYEDFIDWLWVGARRAVEIKALRRKRKNAPITIRHIEPDPLPADVLERRERERWLRPWETLPDEAA